MFKIFINLFKDTPAKDELEFLPAAQEILETPASPTGRILMLSLCTLFFLTFIWAYVGNIDIVSVARGRIVTTERTSNSKITSPIDGFVQQLMIIVPKNGGLEVEAFIENKDIGFIEPAQKVTIKIDTFKFTKYGLIEYILSPLLRYKDEAIRALWKHIIS